MAKHRIERINEEVRKELADIIRSLKDPRIPAMVSIIRVEVTNDFRYAKAFISTLGSEEDIQNAVKGLTAASGYIRREIGSRINLVYTPEFKFVADHSMLHGEKISRLLKGIETTDEKQNKD